MNEFDGRYDLLITEDFTIYLIFFVKRTKTARKMRLNCTTALFWKRETNCVDNRGNLAVVVFIFDFQIFEQVRSISNHSGYEYPSIFILGFMVSVIWVSSRLSACTSLKYYHQHEYKLTCNILPPYSSKVPNYNVLQPLPRKLAER